MRNFVNANAYTAASKTVPFKASSSNSSFYLPIAQLISNTDILLKNSHQLAQLPRNQEQK
jgi:hypothetical protein